MGYMICTHISSDLRECRSSISCDKIEFLIGISARGQANSNAMVD
jgi:hypothetical protein